MINIDLQDKLFQLPEGFEEDDTINDEIYFKSLQLTLQKELIDNNIYRMLVEINIEHDTWEDGYSHVVVKVWNPSYMVSSDGHVQYNNYNTHKRLIAHSIWSFVDDIIQNEIANPTFSLSKSEHEDKFKIKINITN